MPDWLDYIQPELLFLVPLLYGLGELIKVIPNIKNWLIPFILMVVGVALATLHTTISMPFSYRAVVTGITQGLLIALFTVGVNQAVKQAFVGRKIDTGKAPDSSQALQEGGAAVTPEQNEITDQTQSAEQKDEKAVK